MKDPLEGQVLRSQSEAERVARLLGCVGAHEVDGGWMACESPAAFQALLTGGVRAYRTTIHAEEKSIIGRAIGGATPSARSVARSTGKTKRRVRRVAIDPNARDADADNLVQEGTTAERTVRNAAEVAKPRRRTRRRVLSQDIKPSTPGVRSDTPKTPKTSRASKIRSGVAKAYYGRTGGVSVDPRDLERMKQERPRFQPQLDRVDERLKKLGGFGRARSAVDGPLPESDAQRRAIMKKIERRFGKLETLEDHQKALQRAFPNAAIDLTKELRDSSLAKNVVGRYDPHTYHDEAGVAQAMGVEGVEAIKAYARAFLSKSLDDPETANMIGSIKIGDGGYLAAAGTDGTDPLHAPLGLWINPRATAELYVSAREDEFAIRKSNEMATQLERRGVFKGTPQASTSAGTEYADGDIELGAFGTAFHEWAHLRGAGKGYRDEVTDMIPAAQEWVRTGVPPAGMGPSMIGGLKAADDAVKKAMARLPRSEARSGVTSVSKTREFLAELGFAGVDPGNAAQMAAVYRAVAVRVYLTRLSTNRWYNDTTSGITDIGWSKFDTVSGYANLNKEEGLAELMKYLEMMPEYTSSKYAAALKLKVVRERIS